MSMFIKVVFVKIIKLYNFFSKKDRNSVFIVPHHNCKKDKYDIINYKADNALCLFNYLVNQKENENLCITIVIDQEKKVDTYYEYIKSLNSKIKVYFISRNKYDWRYIKHFCNCKNVISTTEYELFPYRVDKQEISCLGYFTPFKNDFIYKSHREFKNISCRNNSTYDHYFSTSDFSSRILSSDSGIFYCKFKSLGFPRNDLFYQNCPNNRKELMFKMGLDSYDKIIVFTPTFRDYESDKKGSMRGLLGYDDIHLPILLDTLKKYNAVLVAKLHPFQNAEIIKSVNSRNIKLYNADQSEYSLYDLLCITDLLITDYTSTVFDYLHTNKPILYYFYDKEEYENTRGFAINPIESICPGHICTDLISLVQKIEYILNGHDEFIMKRKEVAKLVNYYHDGNSAKRICDYLLNSRK